MMTRLVSLGIALTSAAALQPPVARRAFRSSPARHAPVDAVAANAPAIDATAATLRIKAAARVLGGLVGAAATLTPGAALAKGGGYGASSAPSSSSYSSSSYSSAPMRSYAAPARTVVIRQPTRSYYVGGGGPVVVRPPNVLDYALPVAVTGLVLASTLGGEEREGAQRRRRSGGLALYAQELADVKSLMRTLEKDFDASRAPVQRPVSGQYCGDSAEDDKGDQAVVSNLSFGADGSIKGDGIDGVDGAYTLSGRWSGDRCAWIERYRDGFEVAVTGTVERSGDIFILFCSSRGISGSADLKLRTAA
ncbi:unnamed protein product [Pelagomonas calceolata]|uniref:Uncharacterized protein n=1 Tax=Pelagomonas calceolata TaxID=35677 RepID=A0A8J2X2Z1_9STRA|nr:unnamed protein product [Pelagomonas calceolata]|mmetsp:Transcript_10437/g.30753  ORF Transcript_10437/g.30753 Transcript_10437/m.30753 type:complete len:307 (+) Transcript_10437:96-1016(+)